MCASQFKRPVEYIYVFMDVGSTLVLLLIEEYWSAHLFSFYSESSGYEIIIYCGFSSILELALHPMAEDKKSVTPPKKDFA